MIRTVLLVAAVAILATCVLVQRGANQRSAAQLARVEQQLAQERAENAERVERMAQLESERDRFKKDAVEVHRLRAEVSSLRDSNKTLERQLARAESARTAAPAQPALQSTPLTPPAFTTYAEMGKFVGALRAKAFGGGSLSPEERQYLQNLKPELEKLERSPAEFATFQTELIQSATGLSDEGKTEKIRQLIQRVYENAVKRGLDIPARPADDLAWVEERFQLDRRATGAVQGMLAPEERAAFDKQFIGIMGVDLGVGVDKDLYPRGVISTAQ